MADESRGGPIALVGSGEYLPAMAPLEAELLEGRPPVYVQLATAAVPDGPAVVEHWHELGREQAARLGVTAVVVPVNERADAEHPDYAAMVNGAGLIYLSGGNPSYLAQTLRGTAVWDAIATAWRGGAALAGCSAGAMVLGPAVPSLRDWNAPPTPGLGLLPHLRVIPHFDLFRARWPEAVTRARDLASDATVVGVDEETALVGGPHRWRVWGRGSAWRFEPDGLTEIPAGTEVELPPVSAPGAQG